MRTALQEELHRLEQVVLAAGSEAIEAVEATVAALRLGSTERAGAVFVSSVRIETLGAEAERDVAQLLALQAPVAGDLRHALALLYCNLHIQSIADYAVTVARLVGVPSGSAAGSTGWQAERYAGAEVVAQVVAQALQALVTREPGDIDRVLASAASVDAFARSIQEDSGDGAVAEGELAVQLAMVARSFQRIARHAIDIAEQARYLATGEFCRLAAVS
jgi:phosphate transport system protein